CPALWVSSSAAGSTYESGCCGTQTNWSDAQGAPLSVTTPYCGIPSGNEYCVPSTFAPAGTLQAGTVRAPTAACVPNCAGKTCGQSDGCGNTCAGSCGDDRYSCIPGPGTCTDGQPCLQHYCAVACKTDSDCCQIEAYDGQVQYGGLCCMPFNGTHVCGKSESYICPVRSVDICGNLLGDL
ncbi:MAG TPA: hypothetical protein VJU61_06670, partial [Polyangiaceae bacterium]|nr:hypothetical protein [Polyangiaceae bacterium]